MKRVLFISGSPRKGNTEFVLNEVYKRIKVRKKMILLRAKNIKHCSGCLVCGKIKECIIKDDMEQIRKDLIDSDIIVLGTPNYFDNVPGILKDFIDRTNPFYQTDLLKGKEIIFIVVGGGKVRNSRRIGEQALKYFADGHELKIIDNFYFKALEKDELEKRENIYETVNKIASLIKKNIS
ncbi:MAG: flavodoxin family protein [Patescibacteria group bacterium]|nr:flavodoxin family protein [Patescibacteria group bacterium]